MEINLQSNSSIRPLRPTNVSAAEQLGQAEEVQEKFRQFVGEMFFGQLMKAMRSTQDKPAYFHGGRAEEVFQGQMDQLMAEEMTEASAEQIADPMFRQQFPRQAAIIDAAREANDSSLDDLRFLSRR